MYNNSQDFTKLDSNVTPKNDIAFKRIFGTKGNEEILKDFFRGSFKYKDSFTYDRRYNRVCTRL